MEEELLQEIDSLIKPAIQSAYNANKSALQYGIDIRPAMAEHIQREIDNTRVALSEKLYQLEKFIAKSNNDYDIDQLLADRCEKDPYQNQNLPDASEYVQENEGGFKVFNGIEWIQMSRNAQIELKIESSIESNNVPAIHLDAFDPSTKTHVIFVDTNLNQEGFDFSYTGEPFPDDETPYYLPQRNMYWEDPLYQNAKKGINAGGVIAGALEIREIGNFTPWNDACKLKNAKGWYRTKEGLYRNLSSQRGIGAGGHQRGARGAMRRAGKFKQIGKRLFYIGAVISTFEVAEAYTYNDSKRNEVAMKATIDIVISAVGVWGGPVGWAIAGTYFILDVSGAFGDFGKPSGIRADGVPYNSNSLGPSFNDTFLSPYQLPMGDSNNYETEFEVEYMPPAEHYYFEEMMRLREIEIDNTYVAPKILFKN